MPVQYPNAPITEAVIDVRVEAAESATFNLIEELKSRELGYHVTGKTFQGRAELKVSPDALSATSEPQKQVGIRLTDETAKYVWNVTTDGMSLSRLAPYQNWELFSQEAKRLWTAYRSVLAPQRITRLATRTINQLELPGGRIELSDFLKVVPDVPKDLDAVLSNVVMYLQWNISEIESECVLTESLVPPKKTGIASVLLDIDLFRTRNVPSDEDEIWRFFELLRHHKDRVFEASITDKTRELFK